ncbi:MAG: hypothetical protein H7837_06020 [Magnetococcus sp. MYC-9]
MRIYAFYSFKGGVGRTALLTNLAAYWASLGRVVGLVDMDLAAPGLSYLLDKALKSVEEREGFSDLLEVYHRGRDARGNFGYARIGHLFQPLQEEGDAAGWGRDGRIFILPAGKTRFYHPADVTEAHIPPDARTLPAFAKIFREDLKRFRLQDQPERGFDAVLIDCRTGFPELEDLTLAHLADKMVLIAGLNEQNRVGLQETLRTLTSQRIPVGQLSALLTVVFAPTPPHLFDHPVDIDALQRGKQTVESFCRPLPESITPQDELPPRIFTLPYTPRLAVQDWPFVHTVPEHPYSQGVREISEHLLGEKVEIVKKVEPPERVVAEAPFHLWPSASLEFPQESPPIAEGKTGSFLADIVQLPPWHWPLGFGPDQEISPERRMTQLLQGGWKHTLIRAEQFLNAVAGTLSMDKREKIKLLKEQKKFSQFQITRLVRGYDAELQRISAMGGEQADQILTKFFAIQKEWAEIVALSPAHGRRHFLQWPLSAEDPHPFSAWERRPHYWWLLAKELCLEPGGHQDALQAVRRLLALPGKPETRVKQLLDLFEENNLSWNKSLLPLAESAAQGNPWLRFLILQKEQPKPAPAVIQRILQSLVANPPDSVKKLLQLAIWIVKHQPVWTEAAEAFALLAVEKEPENSICYKVFGLVLCQKEICRFPEAEDAFREAIRLDPADVHDSLLFLAALLASDLNRAHEAEELLLKALSIRNDLVLCVGLCVLYKDYFQSFARAFEYGYLGLAMNSEDPFLLTVLGEGLLILGREEMARSLLARALTYFSNRGDVVALSVRAVLLIILRSAREAEMLLLRDVNEALLHHPRSYTVHLAQTILVPEEKWHGCLGTIMDLLTCHSQIERAIALFYDIAGLRSDLRDACRSAIRLFFELPVAVVQKLKGAPTPEERLARYRPFIEGRSRGAGDPGDLHLFCHDPEEALRIVEERTGVTASYDP